MNQALFNLITQDSLRATYKKLGYPFFEKDNFNLNIGVVRASEEKTDAFNDLLFIAYKDNDLWKLDKYPITCDPGSYYLLNLMDKGGTAIIAEGYYQSAYQLGWHFGSRALVQVREVACYRDINRDLVINRDPKTITKGLYGINIHRHFQGVEEATIVYNSSAGCMVFKKDSDWMKTITTCQHAQDIWGNSFSLGVSHQTQWV